MNKIKLGRKNYLYPSPIVLVGTEMNGTPNYITVSYCSLINLNPAMILISISKKQFSKESILKTHKFSINIPSKELVEKVDYCGLVSGRNVSKSEVFSNFYGLLGVPMIYECPVNLECELMQVIELEGTNTVFIGRIMETYSSKEYITNNNPDIQKINPIMFTNHDLSYWTIGEHLGKACTVGINYMNEIQSKN